MRGDGVHLLNDLTSSSPEAALWINWTELLKNQPLQKEGTDKDNRGRGREQESEGQREKERNAWVCLVRVADGLQPICHNHNQSQLNGCDKLQLGDHSLNQPGRLQESSDTRRGEKQEKVGNEEEGAPSIVCSPIGPVQVEADTGWVKGGIKRVSVTGALS